MATFLCILKKSGWTVVSLVFLCYVFEWRWIHSPTAVNAEDLWRSATVNNLIIRSFSGSTENHNVSEALLQKLTCPHLRKPSTLLAPSPNQWQTVEQEVFYVYSAYSDPRPLNQTIIRVFGLMPLGRDWRPLTGETLWCQVWLGANDTPPLVLRAHYTIQGHAAEQYISVEWSCVLPVAPDDLPPMTVSLVVNDSCSLPNTLLHVQPVLRTEQPSRMFTVCLGGVLKNEFGNYHQLVEWIEINRMFGANYFVLYNHNSSKIMDPYVRYYIQSGLLKILPWNLPQLPGDIEDFDVIWNLGQVTSLNDCLYQNMYISKYLVAIDLDEYIVPYGNNTNWINIMQSVPCRRNPGFLFRNAFFGLSPSWDHNDSHLYQNNKLVNDVLHLVTLTRIKQDKYINKFPKRSKYITTTNVSEALGIHNVKKIWNFKNRNPFVCEVPKDQGLMHHYRDPRWDDIEPKDNTYMYKYSDTIIKRVSDIHSAVSGMTTLHR